MSGSGRGWGAGSDGPFSVCNEWLRFAGTGPIYSTPLLETLPLSDGVTQTMPNGYDLERVRMVDERTAAGFEVLTLKYYELQAEVERLQKAIDACEMGVNHGEELKSEVETVKKEFRCPKCGGDHFGSAQTVDGTKYHCHGHESLTPKDPKWPGWAGCGWVGSYGEFLDNFHVKSSSEVKSDSAPRGPLHVVKGKRMVTLYDEESATTIHVIKSGSKGLFVTVTEDPYEEAVAGTVPESRALGLCQMFDKNFSANDLPVLATANAEEPIKNPRPLESVANERLEGVLDSLRGNREYFRKTLTDTHGILRKVCQYAELVAKEKKCEPWSIIGEITSHGSGVSSAIYELYK